MDMYPRIVKPLKSKAFFLFGARGTGKSSFIRKHFNSPNSLYIDLLKKESEERFSLYPDDLYNLAAAAKPSYEWIILDEIQKIPKLLDAVHRILTDSKLTTKLILTGSSARKLRKGAANLLAGRALTNYLFPLTYKELGKDFNLNHYLSLGGLPEANLDSELEIKKEYLRSYCHTYLKEEIWEEQLVRDLTPFRRFIEIASQSNGEILNYSKIARQAGCDTKTIQNYFSILEDTLVGFQLDSYNSSIRKRIISAPKFYLFDCGVKRALDKTLNLELSNSTYEYGKSFEHFIITQMHSLNSYYRLDYSFFYLKTKDGAEIDLIVKRPGKALALIEIKSSNRVDVSDVKNLIDFNKDISNSEAYCFSLDKINRTEKNINFYNWREGIDKIFDL